MSSLERSFSEEELKAQFAAQIALANKICTNLGRSNLELEAVLGAWVGAFAGLFKKLLLLGVPLDGISDGFSNVQKTVLDRVKINDRMQEVPWAMYGVITNTCVLCKIILACCKHSFAFAVPQDPGEIITRYPPEGEMPAMHSKLSTGVCNIKRLRSFIHSNDGGRPTKQAA